MPNAEHDIRRDSRFRVLPPCTQLCSAIFGSEEHATAGRTWYQRGIGGQMCVYDLNGKSCDKLRSGGIISLELCAPVPADIASY